MEAGGLDLQMTRVLPASRARVFEALTEPDQVAKWWGPHGFSAPGVELDVRPGGSYRIAMQPPDGELFHLSGEFREVEPPARLSYTFNWDPPDPDDQETLAAISLEDHNGETQLALTQGPFATEDRRALHDGGWTDAFERLHDHLSAD
jgi:uncharacterized protein YndB with AHSA1/START domain